MFSNRICKLTLIVATIYHLGMTAYLKKKKFSANLRKT